MLKKRVFLISAALIGVLITLMLVTAALWPVISRVETGATPEYPEIQPLYYSAPPDRVFEEVVGGVEALDDFTLVKSDKASFTLSAMTQMPVLGIDHDVEVRVEPVTDFVTRVHTVSSSRVGKGDLGQNARNILAFQAELERRLGAVRFEPVVEASSEGSATPTIPSTE